jgi:two-component system sensor histidine kinase BarA
VTGFAARVATAVWVLVLAACLALSFVFTRGYLEELQKNLAQRGRIIGESVAHESEVALLSGDMAGLARIAARAYAARGLRYCRILDDRGAVVASAGSRQHGTQPENRIGRQIWGAMLGVAPAVWEFRTPVSIAELQPRDEELTFFDHAAPPPEDGPQRQIGTVLVGLDLQELQVSYREVLSTSLLLTAIVVFLAMIAAAVLARLLVRPLGVLVRATDLIAQGALETRVETARTDEIGTLAASFNAMAESVAETRAALEEHTHTLEEKVEARTQRLQALNDELEEANRLKSEFLATVSHELRTPLNVIMGYASMMNDGEAGPVTGEQRELLAAVHRYSKLQLDLITNVLDFSRLASGKVSMRIEVFSLRSVLQDLHALNGPRVAERDVKLILDAPTALPDLETDRVKVQEIIHNLIDNAIKFTEHGSITVRAFTGLVRGHVVIEVADTGVGIPPEEIPHVFEEFRQVGESSTRRTGGVGLGLSIVKGLVGVLGGRIGVQSTVGKGSTFRVELPIILPRLEAERSLPRVA